MSRNRVAPGAGWVLGRQLPKGPNGRNLCRRCGQEVPKGRRTFCGPECVHEWRLRTDPGYVRRKVFARDGGVCSECGLRTPELQAELRAMAREQRQARCPRVWTYARGWGWYRDGGPMMVVTARYNWGRTFLEFVREHGLEWACGSSSAWEADHIVPVVEGGGECGLENYRTLCVPCHKRETAELARRRAGKGSR